MRNKLIKVTHKERLPFSGGCRQLSGGWQNSEECTDIHFTYILKNVGLVQLKQSKIKTPKTNV